MKQFLDEVDKLNDGRLKYGNGSSLIAALAIQTEVLGEKLDEIEDAIRKLAGALYD